MVNLRKRLHGLSSTQTTCLLIFRKSSSKTELPATNSIASRKVEKILRPRSMTCMGTAATHSVEGPEEDWVNADAIIRVPERLAAVALSVFGYDKRVTFKGIVLRQHHLQDSAKTDGMPHLS